MHILNAQQCLSKAHRREASMLPFCFVASYLLSVLTHHQSKSIHNANATLYLMHGNGFLFDSAAKTAFYTTQTHAFLS